MTAKKKKEEKQSNFWYGEKVGDKISGTFTGFFETKYGLALSLLTGKEEKAVALSSVLQNIFKENYKVLKIGKDKIEIKLASFAGSKFKKNPTKIYSVFFNGKEVFGSGGKKLGSADINEGMFGKKK